MALQARMLTGLVAAIEGISGRAPVAGESFRGRRKKQGAKAMRKLFTVTVVAIAGFSVGAASPQPAEVWSCWHSISGEKDGASPVVLVREGGLIKVRGAEFLEYTILQDNDVGLVAVRGYAENIDASKQLGADVVVIDKKTRAFHKTNVLAENTRADDTPRRGTCELQ